MESKDTTMYSCTLLRRQPSDRPPYCVPSAISVCGACAPQPTRPESVWRYFCTKSCSWDSHYLRRPSLSGKRGALVLGADHYFYPACPRSNPSSSSAAAAVSVNCADRSLSLYLSLYRSPAGHSNSHTQITHSLCFSSSSGPADPSVSYREPCHSLRPHRPCPRSHSLPPNPISIQRHTKSIVHCILYCLLSSHSFRVTSIQPYNHLAATASYWAV